MTSRDSNRLMPPQQLYDNYKRIRNSKLILNKSLDIDNIVEFQTYLNDAQPVSAEDSQTRSLIQYLYRKNPNNFCRFLVRSRLSHLILWTEAKCIVRHFGLRGVVYVKWNDDGVYECSMHKNVQSGTGIDLEHPSIQKTIANIGKSEFTERSYDRTGGPNKMYDRDESGRGSDRDNQTRGDNQHRGETRYSRDGPDRDNRYSRGGRGERSDRYSRDGRSVNQRSENQRSERYSRDDPNGMAKRTPEPTKRFQRDLVETESSDDTSPKHGSSDGNTSPTKVPETKRADELSDNTGSLDDKTGSLSETTETRQGLTKETDSLCGLESDGVSISYSKIAQSS
jgi:hypothetical protein